MRSFQQLSLAIAVLVCLANSAVGGVITAIEFDDFQNAKVLSFEDQPNGTISGTDAVFTNFGIVLADGNASSFGAPRPYGRGDDVGRALFSRSGGDLFLQDFDPTGPSFSNRSIYNFTFDEDHEKFGFTVANLPQVTSDSLLITFFDDGAFVGNLSFKPSLFDTAPSFFFQNSEEFDQVQIQAEGSRTSNMFGVTNLTLESTAVPEPSSAALLAFGLCSLLGYGARRRRTCGQRVAVSANRPREPLTEV